MDFSFMNSLGTIITVIVMVPFVVIALVFLVAGLRGRRRAAAANQNWATTQGTILSSEVEARRSSSSHGGHTTSYYPVVFYEYQVDGRTYKSNRIMMGVEVGGMASMAQNKVMQYIPGNAVMVHYNPMNPQEAVLEMSALGSNIFLWIALLIIVILVITGGIMAVVMGGVNGVLHQVIPQIPR